MIADAPGYAADQREGVVGVGDEQHRIGLVGMVGIAVGQADEQLIVAIEFLRVDVADLSVLQHIGLNRGRGGWWRRRARTGA